MMGTKEIEGLYLLAARDIFELYEQEQFNSLKIGVSFYEIYCGKAYDLLNKRKQCAIRVDSKKRVNIVGLGEKIIRNRESLVYLID